MQQEDPQSVTPNFDSNVLRGIRYALPACLLIWIFIVLAAVAYGESPTIGHDFLALQSPHFKYKKIERAIQYPSALGMLDFTFGYSLAPVRYLLDSGKFKYLRVHLINGSCIRLRNCGSYYPSFAASIDRFSAAIRKKDINLYDFVRFRTEEYCQIAKDYPATQVLISPVLEHNLNRQNFITLAKWIDAACPGVAIVNNGMTPIKIRNYLKEVHGSITSKAHIISMDGFGYESYLPADVFEAPHNIVFIWDSHYNCRDPGPFIDPRERTSCPTAREVDYLERRFKR